ncbi:MAG: GAF domain-containing protein [Desulfobacterales bacterium]|nr:GAF domain-containing protein [Desulfobacterales bacterium]
MNTMEQPLYNSRIPLNYIRLIEKKYKYVDVDQLIEAAGMERHQVEDQGHWFSQKQINRFHQRLSEHVWNKNVAREAGMFLSSPDSLGSARLLVLSVFPPAHVYGLFTKNAARFSRSSIYKSRQLEPHKTEITVTPRPGVREEPFQCDNRLGYIEAMARLLKLEAPTIEHPECIFKNGECCRYVISWASSSNKLLRRTILFGLILLPVAFALFSYFFSVHQVALHFLPWGLSIVLLVVLVAKFLSVREMRGVLGNVREVSEELFDQIEENYKTAQLISEIGRAVGRQGTSVDALLKRLAGILEKYLPYDRGMIMLADRERTQLNPKAWYGADETHFRVLDGHGSGLRIDPPGSPGIAGRVFHLQQPVLIDDIERLARKIPSANLEFARKLGVRSCIICPIIFGGKSLGVLAVDNHPTRRKLRQRDLNLLMGIAAQIGVSIHCTILEKNAQAKRNSGFRLIKG